MAQVLYQLPIGWVWMKIEDTFTITSGKNLTKKDMQDAGKYPVYGGNGIAGRHNDFNLDGANIIIGRVGALCGNVRLVKDKIWVTDNAFFIKDYKVDILKEYLMKILGALNLGDTANRAAQPVISYKGIKELYIPYPPVKVQKRVVEKLDALLTCVDTAIGHLQQSVELANALYVSQLSSVFSQENNKWPVRELNQVAEVARGKSKHRPRNDKSLFGGAYPFIQTGNVRNAQKYISTYSTTYNEKGLQQSKLWPKGTICLTIAANIGDVAILDMDACFPDSVVGIATTKLNTDYLYYFLTTLQQQLDNKANAAAQKNINLKILSEIQIPVPSIEEQNEIVKKIQSIDELSVGLKREIEQKIVTMQQLKASILDSAFKGEL
jgi:type I restriction enzyme S subunit